MNTVAYQLYWLDKGSIGYREAEHIAKKSIPKFGTFDCRFGTPAWVYASTALIPRDIAAKSDSAKNLTPDRWQCYFL